MTETCTVKCFDSVKVLLAYGANVHLTNSLLQTPLHIICACKQLKWIVEILVKHGADVNAKNMNSETVIDIASRKSNVATVECLLQNGADVHSIQSDKTIVRIKLDVVEILCKHGWDQGTNYFILCTEIMEEINRSGVPPMRMIDNGIIYMNATNEEGLAPIHYLFLVMQFQFAKELLDCGANVWKKQGVRELREEIRCVAVLIHR
jgi:hypothetical protein